MPRPNYGFFLGTAMWHEKRHCPDNCDQCSCFHILVHCHKRPRPFLPQREFTDRSDGCRVAAFSATEFWKVAAIRYRTSRIAEVDSVVVRAGCDGIFGESPTTRAVYSEMFLSYFCFL